MSSRASGPASVSSHTCPSCRLVSMHYLRSQPHTLAASIKQYQGMVDERRRGFQTQALCRTSAKHINRRAPLRPGVTCCRCLTVRRRSAVRAPRRRRNIECGTVEKMLWGVWRRDARVVTEKCGRHECGRARAFVSLTTLLAYNTKSLGGRLCSHRIPSLLGGGECLEAPRCKTCRRPESLSFLPAKEVDSRT